MTRTMLCLALALPMSLGAGAATAQSPSPDPVLDQELTLSELAGAAIAPDSGITATFAADGSVTGSGGCNTYSASWKSDGTSLTVGPIAATLSSCDSSTDALESSYLAALQAAATWSLDGSALVIVSADGTTLVYGGEGDSAALAGEWPLVSVDGTPVPTGVMASADFGPDGALTGSGGCNQFSGTYTSDGASITVGPLASTRKYCEDSSTIEGLYLDALQGASTWAIDGGTLIIEGTGTLVFGESTASADDLTGQTWILVSQAGEAVDPSLGTSATFGADGRVTGGGGCNQYNASYSTDGDTIAIGPISATRMACPPHVDAAESAYFSALENATGFAIDGPDLVIATTDGSTLEFQAQAGPPPSPGASTGPTAVPSAAAVPSGQPSGDIVGAWTMTEYAGQALPGGMLHIGITFAADGTFSGNGGCNDFTGSWSLDGTRIALSGVVPATGGTCDATSQSLEQGFLSLLPFLDTAQINEAGTLSLVSALAGGTGFSFAPAN